MSRIRPTTGLLIAFAMAAGSASIPIHAEPLSSRGASAVADITYQPPAGAGEKTRIDGPQRSPGIVGHALYVIGSEHTGLTTQEQPSLFYFLDKPAANSKMVLTVLQERKPKPLVEVELDPNKAGVQRVDLSKTPCKLEAGKTYQWVVAIVPPAGGKDKDEASSAAIKRIDPPAALIDQLQPLGSTLDRAVVYAKHGIWYDAFGAISDQIEAEENNPRLRNLRAKLCNQVNLAVVAAYEIKAAENERK